MKLNLEDIDKKNIHKVPNGYFDKLPGIIQSRAVERKKSQKWQWALPVLKVTVPTFVVLFIAAYFIFFKNPASGVSANELLTQVETEDLVAYLASSDITTDEILESLDLDEIEFEFGIESSLLLEDSDLEMLEDIADDYFDINEL